MSFPIIGWAQLPEELTRPEVFANIADSGINVFMTCNTSQEAILRQLDMAAEHGIRALVVDKRFAESDRPGWQDEARAALKVYEDHPGAFGWFVRDEPGRDEFERVAAMIALLRSASPDKVAYVNGFGFGPKGAESFFEYVEQYARIIKPSFLSFDAYPIARIPTDAAESDLYRRDRGVEWPELGAYYRDAHWEAWETYRLVAWKYDLPMWGFALSTPHLHSIWDYGPVTEGTVRLEAFTGLAHGIQALQYFTLPYIPNEGWAHGILDPEGAPSERFEIFQRVNRDVAVLGPVVSDLQCTGVFHTGPLTSYCRRFGALRSGRDTSHYPVARLGGDPVIISFLRKGASRYAMIVNRNPGRKARADMELHAEFSAFEVNRRDGARGESLGARLPLGFEPGDGRLFEFDRVERRMMSVGVNGNSAMTDQLNIFLLIGQSNMYGCGSPEEVSPIQDRRIFMYQNDRWLPASDPIHVDKPDERSVGLGMSFAAALLDTYPTARVGLLQCAFGTPLSCWVPGAGLYDNAVALTRKSLSNGVLKGILWHQGESDADDVDAASTYGVRLADTIQGLRGELNAQEVPFVSGELGRFLEDSDRFNFHHLVNRKLMELKETIPLYGCTSSNGLIDKGDALHFNAKSLYEFGARYAGEYLRIIQGTGIGLL